MPKLIALCGMPGSGKSTVSKYIQSQGLELIHMGSTEETIRRYGKTNEKLERIVRNEMRQEHGMAAMAVLWIDRVTKYFSEGRNVIVDNMYSWSEYKYFLDKLGKENFFTIAIHASPKTRYKRLLERTEESGRKYTSQEEVRQRDYSEIEELEKGGPLAMADFHVVNEGTERELIEIVSNILGSLLLKI